MKNYKILTAGILILALTAAVPSLAQKGPEKKPMMHEEMCCSKLNLSSDQKEKLQKIRLDFQKELLPLKTELKAKMLELRQLALENAEKNQINTKIDEIAQARAEIKKKTYAHHLEIKNILTEEQKKNFGKMCSPLGTHMGGDFMGSGCSCMKSHHGHGSMGHGKEMSHRTGCKKKK